jgi:hypothetical protein
MTSTGHVSMPENEQFRIGVSANYTGAPVIALFHWNDVNDSWEFEGYNLVRYPPGATAHHIDFCRNRFIAAIGMIENKRVVFLFARNSNGGFELIETIEQPPNDRDPDLHLSFATSIAWDNDHCWRLAIGSVSPEYETSRVYVYQLNPSLHYRAIGSQYQELAIIMTVFAAGLVIAVVVAVVGYLILRYRRRKQEQQRASMRGTELI